MWKQILKSVIIAGCLDITAASIQAYVSKGISPDVVLKFIASGWFGKEAYSGGLEYIMFGLLVHFLIVLACTLAYFWAYPKFRSIQKNVGASALLLALIAWTVTTQLIIPLSKIEAAPFNLAKAFIAIMILYFCIGLPIAFLASKYFKKEQIDRNTGISG